MGKSKVEKSLKKLDKLTQEEAWFAQAELAEVMHNVNKKVTDVDKGTKEVDETVKGAVASSSNFQLTINNALDTYKKRTKKDLITHPLAASLQACDTPAAILTIIREQIDGLEQPRSNGERWSKWLDPTVNVLFAFSTTIGAGVGLVCPRTCTHPRSEFSYSFRRHFLLRRWFLLQSASSFQCVPPSISARGPIVTAYVFQAVKDVRGSQNTVLDIFERIEMFFRRLEVYMEVEPTPEMMDMMAQITVEVLSIIGIATKDIQQGRMGE
jgi:hypothetical protein